MHAISGLSKIYRAPHPQDKAPMRSRERMIKPVAVWEQVQEVTGPYIILDKRG
jgi:hypothetical protein